MPIVYLSLAAVGLFLAAGAIVAARSPLTLYNLLAPGDWGGKVAARDIPYDAGPRRRLDIYAPRAKGAGARPVVVFFYGGSWNSGRKEDYAFVGKALAARGFLALVADYRIVPDVAFPAFIEDCAKAVAWVHANVRTYGGDPERLFLMGHSAGAYNAAMVALDGRYLEAAGLRQADIRAVAALAGPFDFAPFTVASTIAAFGATSDRGITQPITYVSTSSPPMLLATGTDDTTVKPRNSRRLAALMEDVARPVRFVEYTGLGHIGILLALSLPFRRSAPVLDDVVTFFEAHARSTQ